MAAFRIFPIADQYDMRVVHMWCSKAVDKATLDLWPPAPIVSSEVSKHPGLLQWLALADSKQCAPLVESCLSQLLCKESDKAIHEAVASPHLRQLIVGLRPETKDNIIFKMAGLPLGFQVLMMSYCCVLSVYILGLEGKHACLFQLHSPQKRASPYLLPRFKGTNSRGQQTTAGRFGQGNLGPMAVVLLQLNSCTAEAST